MRSLIVTRETYRVSSYFLDSVPPGICSLADSASVIARNNRLTPTFLIIASLPTLSRQGTDYVDEVTEPSWVPRMYPSRCWLWFCTHCDNPFVASCCIRNVGVHVTFDVSLPPPIHFSTKDTLRVSCRSLSCLETPDMWDFGEGALQKTGILQFFYRSGKVYTRRVEHSSIPHLWWPASPANIRCIQKIIKILG